MEKETFTSKQLDLLIVSSIVMPQMSLPAQTDFNLVQLPGCQFTDITEFCRQFFVLKRTLEECLDGNKNAKVLMPVDPVFILSIIDFFQLKCGEGTRVNYFSDSAGPLISIANVNVDFLNKKLQDKIYFADNPFDFDKMKE